MSILIPKNYRFTRNPRLETNQEIEIGDTPFSTREEITRLAYVYWEERGKPLGSDEEDWFRAEWELQVRQGASKLQVKTARRLRVALIDLQLDPSPSNEGAVATQRTVNHATFALSC